MNKEQFIRNVINWATARKIIQNGSLEGQRLKFIEEAGELAAAIARNNIEGIKDAIGDMCVVEVIMWQQQVTRGVAAKIPLQFSTFKGSFPYRSQASRIRLMAYRYNVAELQNIAGDYNLTLEECWQAAWDAIKDRRGYMNEQGVFVKEGA